MSTTGKLIAVEEYTHALLTELSQKRRQPIKTLASQIIEGYFRRRAASAIADRKPKKKGR
jgi:hypothetical protein